MPTIFDVILYPVVSEKTIKMIENENKLTFIVHRKTTKKQLKTLFENHFKVKIEKINTLIVKGGKKKAYIKLKKEYNASDLASKLGIY